MASNLRMREFRRVPAFRALACVQGLLALLLASASAFGAETTDAATDLPEADTSAAAFYTTTSPAPVSERAQRIERLGIAGGMLVGQMYTWAVVLATGALVICKWDDSASSCLLPSKQAAWYDLYIPLAGPFIAFRHEEVRSNWKYAVPFAGLGVGQNVGFALAATYFFWPKQRGRVDARVAPWFSADGAGVHVVGAF